MKKYGLFSKWHILPLPVIILSMVLAIVTGFTIASFNDSETSNTNTAAAWTSTLWTQTSQTDFNNGVLTSVNTTSSPGNVRLALTASTLAVTNSPTTNTGSAWTNPANAYGDAGGAATITSGAPSGNNVWGNYGFSSTADAITQVRVRYDAWVAPGMPVFRAAGAKAAGTGAVTPALPAGMAANDIVILVATTIAGGSISITADGSISPWTAIPGSPQDVTGGEKLYVWWGRYSSGSTGPTVTPGSDHIDAGIAAWYGALDSASPIDVSATGNETASDTSFSFATGLTTTGNNEMVLVICTSGVDSNTGQFSGAFTNANLSSISTRMNYQTNSAGGGGFGLAEGQLATAGAVGTWAETLAGASPKAYISFALKPNYSQIRVDISWDGGTSWSSQQTTSLTTSETTYWYDVTGATSWTAAKLADGQLQVRADAYTVGGVAGTVNLDWLPVEVTYYKYASSGTIASQVLDTTVAGSRWDGLVWDNTLPASTNITFEVRAQDGSFAKDAGSPSWTSVGGTSLVLSGLTNSPSINTGSAWTNPANAYADAGGAATITSGAPSGNNVWGNYGFDLTGKTITKVQVGYDAWHGTLGSSPSWVSPTSDIANGWTNPTYAYNGNTSDYASINVAGGGTSNYLELYISAITCDKVRVWSGRVGTRISIIDVDVYYNSQWNNIYSGSLVVDSYQEYAIGSTQSVSGMRIRYTSSANPAQDAYIYEAQFNSIVTNSAPQIKIDVSWDGGSNWSSTQNTALTASETTYWYDVTSATSWDATKLNNANLKVRALAQTVYGDVEVRLDWLPVEVTYYKYVSLSITNGTGRYKQWRATLTPDGIQTSTPTLQEVRVYYYGG